METSVLDSNNNNTTTSNNTRTVGHVDYFSPFLINCTKITYSLIFATGIISNIIAFIGTATKRPLLSLHIYILNLVICNSLMLLLYVPTQVLLVEDQLEWKMGLDMCKIVNAILPVTFCCTIGTLLAIAFDRTRALVKPFKWREDSMKHSKIFVPLIWLTSVIINIPLFVQPKLKEIDSVVHCCEGWRSVKEAEGFWITMFVLVYALPLLILVITHILMICYIQTHSLGVNHKQHSKLIFMGIKLVSVFAVCTGFQHVFFFINASFSNVHLSVESSGILYVVSNALVSVQASINPFLYGSFRRSVRRGRRLVLTKLSSPEALTRKGPIRLKILSSSTTDSSHQLGVIKDESTSLVHGD